MNVIKGLITKDILQLKSYKKTLIIFIMVFAFTSISVQDGVENMLVIMLTLGFGMFSMASFNYDEFNKADRYILTLPLTKKEVVLSKYILVICSTVMGSIIGIMLSYIVMFAMNKQVPNIEEIISVGLFANPLDSSMAFGISGSSLSAGRCVIISPPSALIF